MKVSGDTAHTETAPSGSDPGARDIVAVSTKDFSHVGNFTGYMEVVFRLMVTEKCSRILDIPAGNGLLADRLRQEGHTVVCADINRERPDYIFADMNEPLRFADKE